MILEWLGDKNRKAILVGTTNVLRAARAAFNEKESEAQIRHFTDALGSFNLDLDARRKQTEHYQELAERYCDDRTFLQQLKDEPGLDRVAALMREIT